MDRLQTGDPGQVGAFRLLGRLGEGGMGRVFLGESRGGRKVAIKVVHPHYANDPDFRRRFAHEVAAARQVGGFHTAAVVGADPEADPPWMATAYIPGPSLADAVAQRGPLDRAGVGRLGAALAEGLAAIHECGLIHRDLKPGNVILAEDGPRIIDFGIAKGADATALTGSSAVIGTLRYMSPEQLNGQELTPQCDIFALGTVLAYAATGHDPGHVRPPAAAGGGRERRPVRRPHRGRRRRARRRGDHRLVDVAQAGRRRRHAVAHRPRAQQLASRLGPRRPPRPHVPRPEVARALMLLVTLSPSEPG